MRFIIKSGLLFFIGLCLWGCKKWEDAVEVPHYLNVTLMDEISRNPDLSRFSELLKQSGLDKELATSKNYTVWAPLNNALQNLDPAITGDSARLRNFLSNHIADQSYYTRNAKQGTRVPMLNGKSVLFSPGHLDDARLTAADLYVGNGVLHLIDKAVPVYPNVWEWVDQTKGRFLQNAYIHSLTTKVFDPTNAIVDSVNSQTGEPVYRPGTDSVLRNAFNFQVHDLQDESRVYTYFILEDAAYNAELTRLNPFFKTSSTDSTNKLASFALVKDLVVEGYYPLDQLPSVLISKFGVRIPIDRNRIVETRKLSNGIAHVLSGLSFDLKEKIPAVVVQGEHPRGFFDAPGNPVSPRQNNVSAVFIRSRINPLTNQPFTDMFVYNHGISGLKAWYQARNINSVKYKVYWVAVNDTLVVDRTTRINPVTFNQRLAMGNQGTNFLPLTPATGRAVTPNSFQEIYLGDYVQSVYGTLDMFLTANASTGAGTNSLNLDYIKLVPDL